MQAKSSLRGAQVQLEARMPDYSSLLRLVIKRMIFRKLYIRWQITAAGELALLHSILYKIV